MNEEMKLKKLLIGTTIMFVMTTVGHILVYLSNKEKGEK